MYIPRTIKAIVEVNRLGLFSESKSCTGAIYPGFWDPWATKNRA